MLKREHEWVWDFWLYKDDDIWHIYYLNAPKSLGEQELRHWNVKQNHATSKDLVHWEDLGTCLKPSASPAWDDKTTWTGSTIRDDDGLWHYFYTGTSSADDGMKQRIGHATSEDGHHWMRVGSGLCLDIAGDPHYEEYTPSQWHDRAMRDPWVMRDPDGDGWIMYFTARVPDVEEPNAGGAVGFARSENLYDWQLEAPVFSGGFGQLEVPQVFSKDGKWYCVFCTAAEHWSEAYRASNPQSPVTGSHYLIADSHLGPWTIAPGAFLDGDMPPNRYAGKIVNHRGKWYMMGFLHDTRDGDFIGEISDPIEIATDENGLWSWV